MGRTGNRALLHDHRFVRMASARTISFLGNGFGRVALAFAVLDAPGSTSSELSVVLASQAIPQVFFILVGGVAGDRFSRYRLMVGSDLLAALAWGGLAALVLTGHPHPVALAVLAAVTGLATALLAPAFSGVLPEFVAADHLQTANGILRIGQNVALVIGLALGGATVAAVGSGYALAIDAVSFVVSAALLAGLRLPSTTRAVYTSVWSDLRLGWQEFWSRQWLWVVVLQFSVVVAAVNAFAGVLGPFIAQRSLGGATTWALIVSAQATGTVVGAGFAVRVRPRRPILVAVLAALFFALPMALVAVRDPLWTCMVAMFFSGVALDVCGVLWETTMQREVPGDVLSRVAAYDFLGSVSLAPLGLAVAGPLAALVGPGPALSGCAVLTVAASLAALLSPQVRRLQAPAGPGAVA